MNENGFEFKCVRCGYALRGVPVDALCPECGTPVAVSLQRPTPTSGKAIASMVLGILAVVSCGGYGISIVFGIIALVFGYQAKSQAERGEAGGSTRGMAIAGIACGWTGVGLGVLFLGFIAMVFAGIVFGP